MACSSSSAFINWNFPATTREITFARGKIIIFIFWPRRRLSFFAIRACVCCHVFATYVGVVGVFVQLANKEKNPSTLSLSPSLSLPLSCLRVCLSVSAAFSACLRKRRRRMFMKHTHLSSLIHFYECTAKNLLPREEIFPDTNPVFPNEVCTDAAPINGQFA